MGIAITKSDSADTKSQFLDIAPSRIFSGYWLAGAKELGLELVPMFPCLFLQQEDVPQLKEELDTLEAWANQRAIGDDHLQYSSMVQRIKGLRVFLSEIDWDREEVSIG